jgi:hypothetical protein
MKILWAALALAKIKAITEPPEKHSSDRSHRLGAESLRNIQLTGRVCDLHAFQYIPPVFPLATRAPEIFFLFPQDREQTLMVSPQRFISLLVLVWALFLATGPATARAETRTYELNNRAGEEVARQVEDLYQGSPVTVIARGQQLIVRGQPDLLDEIGTLVETLDMAPVQLRITVRSRTDSGGKRSGAGVSVTNDQVGIGAERRVTTTGQNQERSLVM